MKRLREVDNEQQNLNLNIIDIDAVIASTVGTFGSTIAKLFELQNQFQFTAKKVTSLSEVRKFAQNFEDELDNLKKELRRVVKAKQSKEDKIELYQTWLAKKDTALIQILNREELQVQRLRDKNWELSTMLNGRANAKYFHDLSDKIIEKDISEKYVADQWLRKLEKKDLIIEKLNYRVNELVTKYYNANTYFTNILTKNKIEFQEPETIEEDDSTDDQDLPMSPIKKYRKYGNFNRKMPTQKIKSKKDPNKPTIDSKSIICKHY